MNESTTRDQILATAIAVFAEKGFGATSMNDIVRASGMSKGGIYWHFKSKDDIIAAIFQQYFESQIATLEALLAEDGRASDKIMRLIPAVGTDLEAFAAQFPSSMEFYALAAKNEPLRAQMQAFFLGYRQHLEGLAQEAMAVGEWVAASPTEVAHALMSLFEGMMLLWNVFPEQIDLGSQMAAAVGLLLEGLQARQE